ncbi:MAG TPA: ribbon-helix-helix protein, CopG family [Firmicutes bacterium]|nr:ribbon-helix-helix protein, CopG family [Bacillota bacterium]
MRNVKAISVTLPNELLKEIDEVQKKEMKSCSAVITEAVRQYLQLNKFRNLQKELSAIARAKGIFTEEDVNSLVNESRRAGYGKKKSRS